MWSDSDVAAQPGLHGCARGMRPQLMRRSLRFCLGEGALLMARQAPERLGQFRRSSAALQGGALEIY